MSKHTFNLITILTIFIGLSCIETAKSQGIRNPSEGKSLVYIMRLSSLGAFRAGVNLFPVDKDDEKIMIKVNKLLSRKSPLELDQSRVQKDAEKFEYYISNRMEKYAKDVEGGKTFRSLLPNMYHN